MVKSFYDQLYSLIACEWGICLIFAAVLIFNKKLNEVADILVRVGRRISHSLVAVIIFLVEAAGVLANYLGLEGAYLLSLICIDHYIPLLLFILTNFGLFVVSILIFFIKASCALRHKIDVVKKTRSFFQKKETFVLPQNRIVLLQ